MLPARLRADLAAVLGEERLFDDPATLALYARDETPRACVPAAVAFPASHAEVATLVRIAHRARLPVVARGAGSGNVGGALPVAGGLVVSFECMQKVLEFNPDDRIIVVEAGVVTEEIDRIARSAGLMYAPDPGSGGYCRIGGNLAMNAAGPRCVKYGATRDHVLGLRAVTGDGREIRAGSRTSKYATGYDLTHLLVGSEGTLALITEATLRLIPAPGRIVTLRLCFRSNHAACAAVQRIMRQPVLPYALEFMDRRSIEVLREYGGAEQLPAGTEAVLMLEADGDEHEAARRLAALQAASDGPGLIEVQSGFSAAEIELLWSARKSLSHAVKKIAPLKINEDVVVPVSRLAELVAAIDALGHRHALPLVAFGHAGNGNLHVNLMVHPDDAEEMARAALCRQELIATVLALSGSLSGEHGIGSEKRAFVANEIEPDTLALMRQLKAVFDPHGILNPGKKLPDLPAAAFDAGA